MMQLLSKNKCYCCLCKTTTARCNLKPQNRKLRTSSCCFRFVYFLRKRVEARSNIRRYKGKEVSPPINPRTSRMSWSPAQRNRLAAEKTVLDHYFGPGCVKWIDPTGDTKLEVTLKTNNDNKYTLRIYIENFPNTKPEMVVISSPKPMPNWDGSWDNHTLLKRDGFLNICHYHDSQWTDRASLYQVIMKGRVWLEAYEGHLKTGKPMNYFLREMKNH